MTMASNRIRPARRRCAALLLPLLVGGCLGKGGTTTRYYLIEPVALAAAPAATPLSVEIMDLEIPQYLERFQIATRSGASGIVYAEYHQWGESLRKNLLRTMARNLSALLGTPDVSTPLNRSLAPPDFRVRIHIDRFEQDVDGHVSLGARWQVLDARAAGATPATRAAELESDSTPARGEYARMVEEMAALYGTLAGRIAGDIAAAAGGGP
jgi:uncharacterized lipoprotein YmbA